MSERPVLILHPDPAVRARAVARLEQAGITAAGVGDIAGDGAPVTNGHAGRLLDEADLLARAVHDEMTLRELSDLYTARILDRVNGNKVRAARILGINRRTLYRRNEARRRDAALPTAGEKD